MAARKKIQQLVEGGLANTSSGYTFEDIGREKPVVDWRVVLKRQLEKDEYIWTQRRSIAENNYAYRLEECELEEDAMTEVMIDTSGSVDNQLIRSFLRQLKPLLENSKLKVGCFDNRFHKFTEIEKERDIAEFEIKGRGGTSFNNVVKHFTKKPEVNKIVFTDGWDEMTIK